MAIKGEDRLDMTDEQIRERPAQKVKVHDPKYDTTFKILFGGEDERRTISLLNSVYELRGDKEIVEISIDFTPNTDPEIRDMGRTLIFDVKCRDRSGNHFIIEMQKGSYVGHKERSIYYGARSLSTSGNLLWRKNRSDYEHDLKEGVDAPVNKNRVDIFYRSLPKIHVLSILDYIAFPEKDPYIHFCDIVHRDGGDILSNILSWCFVELEKFRKISPELKGTLEFWLYLLNRRDAEIVELSESITGNDVVIEDAYRRLSCLSEEEEERVEQNIQTEIDTAVFYGTQISAAEKKGIEKGEKIGIEKGRLEEKREMAQNFLNMGLSIEEVSKGTGLSQSEVEELDKSM